MTEQANKGGFWKSMKSLVVEDVPEATSTAQAPTETPSPPASPPTFVAPLPAVTAPDPEIVRKLESMIAEKAPKGYVEVNEIVGTLGEVIADEGQRYRTALKLAISRGHSATNLLEDVDVCLRALEQAKTTFQDEFDHQLNAKVGAKEAAAKELETSIATKRAQIASLNDEILQAETCIRTNRGEAEADRRNLGGLRGQFLASYQAVKDKLQSNRDKISTYGKGG